MSPYAGRRVRGTRAFGTLTLVHSCYAVPAIHSFVLAIGFKNGQPVSANAVRAVRGTRAFGTLTLVHSCYAVPAIHSFVLVVGFKNGQLCVRVWGSAPARPNRILTEKRGGGVLPLRLFTFIEL